MDKPDLSADPHFSQPVRQIVLMLAVLVLSGLAGVMALPRVLPIFESNPYLNGFIFFVFLLGVVACFWQVAQLIISVRWIENFASDREKRAQAPQMLAPLATLLRTRGKRMQITTTSTRSILEFGRTAHRRRARDHTLHRLPADFPRTAGTFYGLATTVPALVETIRSLVPQEGESGVEVFSRLMEGLQNQLGGMGVAFASSLLGLTGSLIVGLLELFAGHGQNRFYRELEEWLSSITRLGFSDGDGSGEMSGASVALDAMADQMEELQGLFARAEMGRSEVDGRLGQLADAVERMTERLEATAPSSNALARIADGQERLIDVLSRKESSEGLDAESRMRLRSIDVQMLRILEEISAGRQESMAELRTDLSALSRVLGQMGRQATAPASPPATGQRLRATKPGQES